MQAALDAYDRGDLQHARPLLLDLVRQYPADPQVEAATGMTLAELGDVQGSLPYLEKAHTLTPHQVDIATNLAVAYLKLEEPSKAVPVLRDTARDAARDAHVRALLAQALLKAGDPTAACASFQQAALLLRTQGVAPGEDFSHDQAVALLQSGRAKDAAALLNALPGVKNSASLTGVLAEAEERTGSFEPAVAHFKRATELDPSEPNLFAYGNELLQHWTFTPASEILRFGLQRFPASDRMQMALGIAYYGNNQYSDAVPVFQALLARRPDSATAADLLGRSCSAISGAQQAGCAALRTFAETHPQNAPASLYAAVTILHQPQDQQDAAAAETLLRNALHADPRLADAWYHLGTLQQSRGDWKGSADSLDHAVALRPSYPEAHYRLGRAYSHLGKRDEAQQQIALQQKFAAEAKQLEGERMKEVMTFLTASR